MKSLGLTPKLIVNAGQQSDERIDAGSRRSVKVVDARRHVR